MTHDGLWNELKLQKQVKFLQDKCRKAGKRIREAEGELSIIKGIGNNSPEMRALQKRVKELEEIEKSHKKLNGELNVEIVSAIEELRDTQKELELEKKNHAITKEDVQLKDLEIGRMMEKLNKK